MKNIGPSKTKGVSASIESLTLIGGSLSLIAVVIFSIGRDIFVNLLELLSSTAPNKGVGKCMN